MREEIFQYVKKKYKVEPDYPFSTAPTYPVLRHKDNRKWFALIMDIPSEKLGLEGSEHVDIMNVKLGRSHAGGYDRPAAGVFLRVSHYQKQLDLHSPGRDGAV